jgi:hypothetical protein
MYSNTRGLAAPAVRTPPSPDQFQFTRS